MHDLILKTLFAALPNGMKLNQCTDECLKEPFSYLKCAVPLLMVLASVDQQDH